MKQQCSYCLEWFENTDFKQGETFKGIDEHHNPPKFLTGEAEWSNWEGSQFLNLCRDHHRELHDEILRILNRKARTLKFVNSEHWVLKQLTPTQKKECAKEVFDYTNKWISQKNSK